MTLHVEVVSPERILWTGDADRVIARTIGGGEIAFLTGFSDQSAFTRAFKRWTGATPAAFRSQNP